MKKLIIAAAIACAAAFANAATVGWSALGAGNYANDAYSIFVIGQKGVSSIATVTALLDAGSDISSYAFGSGKIGSTGGIAQSATAAGAPTLGEGTYTSFMVVFDAATPVSGTSKYAVISGIAGQTQTVGPTTAKITFASLNISTIVNDTANWKSFGTGGDTPEPTSAMLLLLGVAGLALRRKAK